MNKENLFISLYDLYKPGADTVWSQSRVAVKKYIPTAKNNFKRTQTLMFLKNRKGYPNSKTMTIVIKTPFRLLPLPLILAANPEHFNPQFPIKSLNTSFSFLWLSSPSLFCITL